MKKLFTLMFTALLASGMYAAEKRYDVVKVADLTDALNDIETQAEGFVAYVYITGDINAKTLDLTSRPNMRNIHFIGIDDEEGNKATLRMEMKLPANNTESSGFSLHYENLRLMQSQSVWGNSKHLMNFKDANKHYIDTLEFVNCELTELCRSIYRAEAQSTESDAGTMKVFRMENCVVHNGFRQYDAMPAIYMAQPVNEMTFRNNTFYDLTYLNSIVSFGTMTENTGRQAVKVFFENNTVCAYSRSSLLNYGIGVSSESEFHIKNNIILQPNWIDEMNGRQDDNKDIHGVEGEAWTDSKGGEHVCRSLTDEELQERIEKGVVFTGIQGGLVQLENNMLYGYKYQDMKDMVEKGDIIPIGDTEEEFFDDFAPALAMEDVPFAWTDFANAQNDFFQISFSNPAYTAGKNGAPLGDTNNYTNQVIKVVTVSVTVEGSQSAKVTISPDKAAYMAGDEITLTANCNGSLNTFKGWSNGMTDQTITLTLTDDIALTATFEEMKYIAVWNLDDITTNNVVKTPPVKTNYGGGLALDYARYIAEEETYKTGEEGCAEYDGAKKAIQTRNNKVSGDIRNCFLITTPYTQFTAGEEGKADYLIINVNEKLDATKLQFYVASDNISYNKYAVSYSTDGTTWTEATTFEMEGRTQTNEWYLVEVNLPALAEGSQIRIKGDETSGMALTDEMKDLYELEALDITTEFLFIAEIILTQGSGETPGIKGDVNKDGEVDVADISAIITVMAGGDASQYVPDVNTDGEVDVADISSVITIMAGK